VAIDRNIPQQNNNRDAVCIQTDKVYDLCKDKECLENLRVYFSECDQNLVDRATSVKFRRASIIWVIPDVEPLAFNRGYYSVDISFFFKIQVEVSSGLCRPSTIEGLATYTKKVILFGSEGSAYIFTSDYVPNQNDLVEPRRTNLPKAVVEIVDPIALNAKLVDVCCDCDCDDEEDGQGRLSMSDIPDSIAGLFDGGIGGGEDRKRIYVTIGIFVIVKLERTVQLLIPSYDFCIPEKDCVDTTDDDPCTLFEKIKFPFDEFYPPREHKEEHHHCV